MDRLSRAEKEQLRVEAFQLVKENVLFLAPDDFPDELIEKTLDGKRRAFICDLIAWLWFEGTLAGRIDLKEELLEKIKEYEFDIAEEWFEDMEKKNIFQ